jgi:predicted RNase H-like HicB family nuclease
MRFSGLIYKHGRQWLAEVPIFDAITQGETRREALEMIEDWFTTMVDRPGFRVRIHHAKRSEFQISGDDTAAMISLLLRRQRQRSRLSLAEAAERLGAKSRNAYARYESGASVPTVVKLEALLKAISPDHDIVVHESREG